MRWTLAPLKTLKPSPLSYLGYTLGEVLMEAKGRGGGALVAKAPAIQISRDEVLAGAEEFRLEQSVKWKRFCERFPEESTRDREIERILDGSGAGMSKELRQALAMEKWG